MKVGSEMLTDPSPLESPRSASNCSAGAASTAEDLSDSLPQESVAVTA